MTEMERSMRATFTRSRLTPIPLLALGLMMALTGCHVTITRQQPRQTPASTATTSPQNQGLGTGGGGNGGGTGGGAGSGGGGGIAGAADLSSIPGLPSCLPPGFVLPEGTVVTQGLDKSEAEACKPAGGGSFRVAFPQSQDEVVSFLRGAYTEPTWQMVTDSPDTITLSFPSGDSGPLAGWKLSYISDPENPNGSSVDFTIFTWQGRTEGKVDFVPAGLVK